MAQKLQESVYYIFSHSLVLRLASSSPEGSATPVVHHSAPGSRSLGGTAGGFQGLAAGLGGMRCTSLLPCGNLALVNRSALHHFPPMA